MKEEPRIEHLRPRHSLPYPLLALSAVLLILGRGMAVDYYWTGDGDLTPHGNRDWATGANWETGGVDSGVVPTEGPAATDNVFLINSSGYLGDYYVSPDPAPITTQIINNLTVVSGFNNIGSRYTPGAVDLIVNGNFEILAGSFYGGPYSPNWMQFKGGFTAASGTTLGNNNSTSDGGYWDLSGATSIALNGTTLNQMTNNWQFGPQLWNFGASGTTTAIQLTNNNTFNLVQDVVNAPRMDVGNRGAQMLTIYNPITGAGGFTKTGDATLVLEQAGSSYLGATNINGGILVIRGGNAIGDSSAVTLSNFQGGVNGGSVKATLSLESNETIGSLAGGGVSGGNVILNGNTLTMGGNNSSTTFAGVIAGSATGATQGERLNQAGPPSYAPYAPVGYLYSPLPALGAGNLVKTGTGALTLTGENLYAGTTTLQQGTIIVTDEVKEGEAGPLGQSSSAIVWGDATTPSSANADTGNVTLIVENRTGSTVDWTFDRDLDGSALSSTIVGRPRFVFNSTNAADTSVLTMSGDISFAVGSTTGRYEMAVQRAGMLMNITGQITGSGSVMLWNGSNQGVGTIRLGNSTNSYALLNKVLRGTLVVAGSVGALGEASAIGTGALDLGADGAPLAVNVAGGINTTPGFFMETPGATFARTVNLGTVATYMTNGVANNGIVNGYRVGGVNTTGLVTFSGNITSPNAPNGLTNLALFAEGGGAVEFSGVINDNGSATQVTRVTVNQLVNHPDLNATDGGANQAVGTATTGTVILSGANTYAGGTEVRGGTLLANNTTGSATGTGDVTVLADARLGGTGSITGGAAGSITLGVGSQLMVGATHGTGGTAQDLVLGNSLAVTNVGINLNGSLQFDLTGAGSLAALGSSSYNSLGLGNDLLEIFTTGNINLDDGVVELVAVDTSMWIDGHTWKLIDWSNAAYSDLSTDGLTLGTTSINGFVLSQTITTDGYYVTATVIPEPGRAMLLMLGLGVLLVNRRRRRD
ncbi:PEP-CTERM sorting domain-containing protein [Phragmitibacter flavus]|uniref:PEP-CTERM sorting domain-containing protein n=1 Tax=Phragmitibacter flavus TaxID=2576071 RepID=A0A5R8KFA5_9BACT|nr:autotransporter-associated beta strand repeat-containing protein [Phragmitibacter flavus]TLD70962.1 PEP-CTERM sorting domain-containing protein [Phragmitibacter flavus]